ncbi:MAG: hypothetical protein WB425_16845 [Terracidiphilus sp.]
MNSQILDEWLTCFSLLERAKALNLVNYQLTIYAREYGLLSTDSDKDMATRKLLGISELSHKLTSQIGHYLNGYEADIYPVNVFSQILFDVANHYNVTGSLQASISSAQVRIRPSQA